MGFKALQNAANQVLNSNIWKKFVKPTVGRGKTVWPQTEKDLEKYGIRWDYDGEVTVKDVVYHKYQCQPNAGKVPTSIKKWREANGGTHAVMGNMLVKKDGEAEDVRAAMDELIEELD